MSAGLSTISDGRRRSCFAFRWRRFFSALLASRTAAWAAARSAACGSSMIESDDDRVCADESISGAADAPRERADAGESVSGERGARRSDVLDDADAGAAAARA